MKLNDLELFGILAHRFHEKNDYLVRHQIDSDDHGPVFVERRPAELFHEYDIDELDSVDSPRDVFVTTTDLVKYTGYSWETIRRRVRDFVQSGIVVSHGKAEGSSGSRTEDLYMPADEPPERTFAYLLKQAGHEPPDGLNERRGEELPTVSAGMFSHVGGGEFVHEEDETISIDVDLPAGSIKSHVKNQLHAEGLTVVNASSFAHQLRSKANFVE